MRRDSLAEEMGSENEDEMEDKAKVEESRIVRVQDSRIKD